MAHVVFSGLESPKDEIGIECPDFETKAEIEKYIKEQKVGLLHMVNSVLTE